MECCRRENSGTTGLLPAPCRDAAAEPSMAVMALPARLLVQPVAKVNTLLSYSAAVQADMCWAVAGRRPRVCQATAGLRPGVTSCSRGLWRRRKQGGNVLP